MRMGALLLITFGLASKATAGMPTEYPQLGTVTELIPWLKSQN
jgi:hypothetical protein